MEKSKNVYETDNLALCPYLMMQDLKYLGIKKDSDSQKYVFVFEDDKHQGPDLALAFLKSEENKYKKFWSFFRNELCKAEQRNRIMRDEHAE